MEEKKGYVSDNAQLMAEWNWEKNSTLGHIPTTLTVGMARKVWWKCSQGHEWEARISHRQNGAGCPYCSGLRAIKGENDLQTVNPDLAKEWNYEKNEGLTPSDVLPNSNKKVWWKCKNGHEWKVAIYNRSIGNGCPFCAGQCAVKGVNDLQTLNPILAMEWNYERNIGLNPSDFMPNSNKKVWWKCKKGHEWKAFISNRAKGVGCPVCSSEATTSFPEYVILYYLKKHQIEAIQSYNENGYELDIFIPALNIAIEYDGYFWHKNKSKKDLAKNLRCKKDGIILYRIRECLPNLKDSSIDFIIEDTVTDLQDVIKRILYDILEIQIDVDISRDFTAIENLREHSEKERSLSKTQPLLAQEWNYEKNGDLSPDHVTSSSGKKVWWICKKCGYSWQARVADRSAGNGCPYCSGKIIIEGFNDLKSANPFLTLEWNYEKNKDILPTNISPNSNRKVWWICSKGHEWQAVIANRHNRGNQCPYCSGRYAVKGVNDLKTVNPRVAEEWDYIKNEKLSPYDVLPNSNKKVWWKCSNGHTWRAQICDRNKGSGCPYCYQHPTKKVINKDTGEIFKSITDAAKKHGIQATHISGCCKGTRKTAGGYHWKYVVEE